MPSIQIICLLSLLLPTVYSDIGTPKHLAFPPPNDPVPTKVQLILGLGIPMDVVASTIVGYVIKSNYNLPYNASIYSSSNLRERSKRSSEEIKEDNLLNDVLSRYEVYKMLESAVDDVSQETGKACLLRAICEAAAIPLDTNDNLFAQILHVFLTPSSTEEKFKDTTDQEYRAAESIGFERGDGCAYKFRDCSVNVLEYLSIIN